MFHYTYKITDESGNFYFGSRSSHDEPEKDKYMGSGVWVRLQKKSGTKLQKKILRKFKTRSEACRHELELIHQNINQDLCRNISLSSGVPSSSWSNPFKLLLNDDFLALHKKAVLLWVEVVALGYDFGISNKILAQRNKMKISECDNHLELMMRELPDCFPKISKYENIWKLNK